MEQRVGSLSRLASDGRAFSVQTTIFPEEAGAVTLATAEALAAGYFASLSWLSGGFLTVVRSPGGIALRLRGVRAPLLAFDQAGEVPEPEGAAVGYGITGGLLLKRGAQGGRLMFRAAQAGAGVRATVDLEGFVPAVLALPGGRALYRFTQAPLIAWTGRRFLRALRRRPECLEGTGR